MEKEIVRTVCEGCMSGCGVLVHKENGRSQRSPGTRIILKTEAGCVSRASRMTSFSIIRIGSSIHERAGERERENGWRSRGTRRWMRLRRN